MTNKFFQHYIQSWYVQFKAIFPHMITHKIMNLRFVINQDKHELFCDTIWIRNSTWLKRCLMVWLSILPLGNNFLVHPFWTHHFRVSNRHLYRSWPRFKLRFLGHSNNIGSRKGVQISPIIFKIFKLLFIIYYL